MRLYINLSLSVLLVLALAAVASSSRAAPAPTHKSAHFLPSRFNIPFERFKRMGEVFHSNIVVGYYPLYCSETTDGRLALGIMSPSDAKTVPIEFTTALTPDEYLRGHREHGPEIPASLFLVLKGQEPMQGVEPSVTSVERVVLETLEGRAGASVPPIATERDRIYVPIYDYKKGLDMAAIARDGRILTATPAPGAYQVYYVDVDPRIQKGEYYIAFVTFNWGTSSYGKDQGAEVATNPYIRVRVE